MAVTVAEANRIAAELDAIGNAQADEALARALFMDRPTCCDRYHVTNQHCPGREAG